MPNWPSAILFDFDGVIVNSEPLHFEAFQAVLAAENIDLSEDEYYSELIGFDDRGAMRHIFQKHKRPLEPKDLLRLVTRKSEAMMELIQRRTYKALPGAEAFIRALWRNYPLAICSGALSEEIEVMLEGVNLRDCFPVIIAAEDVTIGKPDPQGYLMAAKALSAKAGKPLTPKDCLIIEDAPSVIANARKAGFEVLAVASSYPSESLAHASYVVPTLDPAQVHKKIPQLKLTM